jgi:branched-subunit amino acid transport protein
MNMTHNIYIYILVAAAVSCLIRVLPLTLIRGKIKNPLIRSFLYYVPYVTLAVMTFPAIITAPQVPIAGILALAAGILAAWRGINMMGIAALSCIVVFICEAVAAYLI